MTQLLPAEARLLTNRIKASVTDVLDLIAEAFDGRADVALGYESWDRYCHAEFPAVRWAAPEERERAVARLKDRRMSNRAIGHALNMDEKTVRGDLARMGRAATAGNAAVAQNGQTVRGLDNKTRPAARCKPVVIPIRTHTSPFHYARQAAAIVADIDAQHFQPGDLTLLQLQAIGMLRHALAEFASIMQTEEEAQEQERAQ